MRRQALCGCRTGAVYDVAALGGGKDVGLPESGLAKRVLQGHGGFAFSLGGSERIVDRMREVPVFDARVGFRVNDAVSRSLR